MLPCKIHQHISEFHRVVVLPKGEPENMISRDEARTKFDSLVAPFLMSGGTDAKSFERLGMRCFGFSPLRLPPDLDFASLFHGIDERVPVESLQFGIRVLDRFLRSA